MTQTQIENYCSTQKENLMTLKWRIYWGINNRAITEETDQIKIIPYSSSTIPKISQWEISNKPYSIERVDGYPLYNRFKHI